jgi:hypothetical protein
MSVSRLSDIFVRDREVEIFHSRIFISLIIRRHKEVLRAFCGLRAFCELRSFCGLRAFRLRNFV